LHTLSARSCLVRDRAFFVSWKSRCLTKQPMKSVPILPLVP